MTVRLEGSIPAGEVAEIVRLLRECRERPSDMDESLPSRLLSALEAGDEHHASLVRILCELATDADPLVSRLGQHLLFPNIAEALGDSFAPDAVAVHDSVFSHVIEFCRRLPAASHVDERLAHFGIGDRMDLLNRRPMLTPTVPISREARERVRKVFVLSRITLGADVAVTSLVLQGIRRAFPNAERCFVGPSGSGELLMGLEGTRVIEQSYSRGGLLERLDAWHRATQTLARETTGLASFEWLVIDPDSRVTQLGMLPVAHREVPYLFFESRSYFARGLETLGALTLHWLKQALELEGDEDLRPRVALSPTDVSRAQSILDAFKPSTARFVVAVNLGVGGNQRKRIEGDFERNLVRGLLRDGSGVILDHGSGEDESRVQAIVEALRAEGHRMGDVTGGTFNATVLPPGCDVVAYCGPVAPFAALIGASDLYIGYDSAFQHVAAAQGVSAVDVFVNPPNATFARRWKPHSSAPVSVIETTSADGADAVLDRIAVVHRQCRQAAAVP
jgi:ADP-heptose:LPS heptosyltransferase